MRINGNASEALKNIMKHNESLMIMRRSKNNHPSTPQDHKRGGNTDCVGARLPPPSPERGKEERERRQVEERMVNEMEGKEEAGKETRKRGRKETGKSGIKEERKKEIKKRKKKKEEK